MLFICYQEQNFKKENKSEEHHMPISSTHAGKYYQ